MLKTGLTTSIFVSATLLASSAFGAVAARHYDFEEGTAGAATTIVQDITTDPLIESDLTGIWETGHFWLEVAGSTARPLPAGGLFDVIDEWALAAPTLESLVGEATFVDVSDGTAFDSPAIGSQLALSFDGDTYFDDINSGSRGVYIERTAYENNDDVSPENTAESFNMIAQGWVYPSSEGMSIAQTVWQSGTEQGSVNITEDGFWEFRDLSSVGDLNPDIAVEFDTWTHIGTRRGGNGAEVFINGELVAGDINPTPPNFFGGFANIITLGGTSATEDGFYGMVDDFKIMGTADLAFDPAIDMDFWATAGPDPCMPVNELLGDLDGVDGVAFADFLVLSTNFGTEVDSYSDGDIDCSGSVDFPDFLTMSANFGMTVAGASPVPEPNGFALLLMGMLTLVRRKRNRAVNALAC